MPSRRGVTQKGKDKPRTEMPMENVTTGSRSAKRFKNLIALKPMDDLGGSGDLCKHDLFILVTAGSVSKFLSRD